MKKLNEKQGVQRIAEHPVILLFDSFLYPNQRLIIQFFIFSIGIGSVIFKQRFS